MLTIEALIDNDNCRAQIKFGQPSAPATITSATITRSSSNDGFLSSETLASITPSLFDATTYRYFYDYTIEPGVFYKYSLVTNAGTVTSSAVISSATGSYLLGESGIQLNFIYNGSISDFKQVKKDSVIETIGSAFPFIIRAGAIGYKQFGYSGTAVSNVDTSKSLSGETYAKLFGNSSSEVNSLYSSFISDNGISKDYNFILEKQFRKKMLDWVNSGKAMLFKSDTEGLVLGRITEVSMNPIRETGRVIYETSFTFTEIENSTISKMRDFGILKPLSYLYTASDLTQLTFGSVEGNF